MKFFTSSLLVAVIVTLCLLPSNDVEAFKMKKLKKAALALMLLQAAKPKDDPMPVMMMMNGE